MSHVPPSGGEVQRRSSIRRRLLLMLLPVTLVVWIGIAWMIYSDTQQEIEELTDAQLAETARALLNLLSHEYYEERNFQHQKEQDPVLRDTQKIPQRLAATLHQYEQSLIFQMWIEPDNLVLRSEQAPEIRLSHGDNGFSDEEFGGHEWRVFSLSDPETEMLVQVAERQSRRQQLQDYIARRILLPVFIAMPFLAWLIWYGVGRAMRPLNQIADDVARLQVGHLERIESGCIPLEAQSLVDALNALLSRLQLAFENERRFTADAAHELRTPLAALRTLAQVAHREAEQVRSRQALQRVIQGVDRATHLVQQLLTLARIDPEHWSPSGQVIDLGELVSERLAAMSYQAIDKQIEISLVCSGECMIEADRDMLDIMLVNLLGNAIKYTPRNGVVEVVVEGFVDGVMIRINDSGEGVPESDREQIFERFYRRDRGSTPGCGLGLSIVHRIMEIVGAQISLGESHLGGLLVEVRFARGSQVLR